MAYGVRLRVWGEYACFTRPEMKVERVSYDVITPSAARGILEAIHWKPAIRWIIDRLHVLKPIRFESIRRNEVGHKLSAKLVAQAMKAGSPESLRMRIDDEDNRNRQQRAATVLRDVDYVIEAHFEMTTQAGAEDTPGKHLEMFSRRARRGQCFHMPCLGVREFPASFALLEADESQPLGALPSDEERDLGWMLHDIDFADGSTPRFFRACMKGGVIEVPPLTAPEVRG